MIDTDRGMTESL